MFFCNLILLLATQFFHGGMTEESTPSTPSKPPSTVTTTTLSTVSPASTFFPCKDTNTLSCEKSLNGDKTYCKRTGPYFAYARSNCCYTCSMFLGFTVTKSKRVRQPNGQVITVLINVVDLTSTDAMTWSALPKDNTIYPGLSASQTNDLCNKRVQTYGAARLCSDTYARTVCGKACLAYNYPNGV